MDTEVKQLLERLRNGDERAFETLVKAHQVRVYNVCLSLLKNEEDAEDIAQEVFVEVLRKIRTFRGDSKLSTWLYRISINKSLEELRRRSRKRRWAQITSLWGESGEDLNVAKDFEHPGVILEHKEKAKILFDCIDALPANQQVAFTLHKVEGLPYGEVAVVMQLTISAVESLLFRARKNLKKSLAGYYYAEHETRRNHKS